MRLGNSSMHCVCLSSFAACMAGDMPDKSIKSWRDPVLKGLQEAVRLAEQCEGAYLKIQDMRAPTVAVFEATRQAVVPRMLVFACSSRMLPETTTSSSVTAAAGFMSIAS